MRTVFSLSRYVVLIAVIGLLVAAIAVFVFGGITSVVTVIETFQHGEYNAEGARILSVEMVELIDLFLLGTILLMTSTGLYQLFIDPHLDLPEWLSVAGISKLKFNLVAVVVVMLIVLFVGAVAEWEGGNEILAFGAGIALVVAAAGAAVVMLADVEHRGHAEHATESEHE